MNYLKIDDFIKYRFISNIRISPDGQNVGFVVQQANLEDNNYRSNIYTIKEDGHVTKLTSLDKESSLLWKDKDTIIFPAIRARLDFERKEKGEIFTAYYEIDINGGEANKVFEIPIEVNNVQFINNSLLLVNCVFDPLYSTNVENKDIRIIDEIPFWQDGGGFTNKKRNRLYIYDIKSNHLSPITDEFTNVDSYDLDNEKKRVIYTSSSFIDKMSIYNKLNIYDIEYNSSEDISPIKRFNYEYCNFIGEDIIFMGKDMDSFGLNENADIYLLNLVNKKYRKIVTPDRSKYNSVLTDSKYGSSQSAMVSGDEFFFITTDKTSSYIDKINKDGTYFRLVKEEGSIDGFDVRDGKVYFIGMRGLNLQEVYLLNEEEKRLTDFNRDINKNVLLSKPEKLILNYNGIEVEGFVLKPVNYDDSKSYPALLSIHGGPKTVFGDIYFHEMQYLANNDYFVFYCNPRGSDGYGDEFSNIFGKYGTIDYEDIMNFTNHVLKNYPSIDRARLGVMGGSYGGFMTNWIIGQTDRFKVAISERSIANWTSFFGNSDIGYYFTMDQVKSTPWTNFESLWEQSPIKHADRIITPTLFINSVEDYRCPVSDGMQMFSALKYHGVDSKLMMFQGENHNLSRTGKPLNKIGRLKEMLSWLDKYLK